MSDMTQFDMTCDELDARLADYLEGDASASVRAALESHAAHCARCGALAADLLALPSRAAALPVLQPSRDLWHDISVRIDAPVRSLDAARPSLRRGWMRPALAAAALVLFTASVTHFWTRASLARTEASPARALPVSIASAATDRSPAVPDATPRAAVTPGAAHRVALASAPAQPIPAAVRQRVAAAVAPAGQTARTPVRFVTAEPAMREARPMYDREIGLLRTIVHERRAQLDPATVAVLEQSVAVIDSAIAQSRAALARDPASGFLATQLNHSLEKKVELLRLAASLPART
jgi:hypothetical protein